MTGGEGMAASDVLRRVHDRCPHPPGSGKWVAWITAEMDKVEGLDAKILAVQRKEEDERRRHRDALQKIRGELKALQPYCDHDMRRGVAENEPTCQRCGYVESGAAGYDG